MKKTAVAAFGIAFALVSAFHPCVAQDAESAFQKQLRELKWIRGPQQVSLFGNSTLQVPAGYLFLNPEETSKLEALTHNISPGKEYFLAPDDLRWGGHFNFQDDGYVKDDEAIDAPALLENIKQGTEAANAARRQRGWDEMAVIGWQTPPHYDTQSNRLEWAVSGKDLKTNSEVVNFNTRILGRSGVMSAVLIAAPQELTAATNEFNATLSGFTFSSGQRYAEYKPGDKIAKYGLAALVTGGAAAIAVKTGFWKVIAGAIVAGWKFVAAAGVALVGAIARRFKRKTA
jgi:uncharacterized membrane-anchored protein